MHSIHRTCVEHGTRKNGYVSYIDGANIGGFLKIADAMVAYGAV
jgi:glutamate dehydrogenase (NADP+)